MLFAEIVKEKANDYANKLADFAINHFKEFKEIVNNDHFTDNELMWVFMFYINRIAEQYTIDGKGKKIALYRHKDGGGSWNFDMEEVYENLKKEDVARAYNVSPEKIEIIGYNVVNSIKITFPRKNISGSIEDNDIYGCQQHVPLANLEV